MASKKYKKIALDPGTYEELSKFAWNNEDFDAIVKRLMRNYRGDFV